MYRGSFCNNQKRYGDFLTTSGAPSHCLSQRLCGDSPCVDVCPCLAHDMFVPQPFSPKHRALEPTAGLAPASSSCLASFLRNSFWTVCADQCTQVPPLPSHGTSKHSPRRPGPPHTTLCRTGRSPNSTSRTQHSWTTGQQGRQLWVREVLFRARDKMGAAIVPECSWFHQVPPRVLIVFTAYSSERVRMIQIRCMSLCHICSRGPCCQNNLGYVRRIHLQETCFVRTLPVPGVGAESRGREQ